MSERGNNNIARVTVEQTIYMVNLRDGKVGILHISRNAECWCDDASGLCTAWSRSAGILRGSPDTPIDRVAQILSMESTLFSVYNFGIFWHPHNKDKIPALSPELPQYPWVPACP